MNCLGRVVYGICGLLACGMAAAADGTYRASLFNGRDLDGWQVTGCDAVVEDGLLVLKAGDGFVRTNERHGDFVLELDWRAASREQLRLGHLHPRRLARRRQAVAQPATR